jgi:hypothetical protein
VSCGTRVPFKGLSAFAYRAVTVYGRPFHAVLLADSPRKKGPTTPDCRSNLVWARPRSLAATKGISIDFFSTRYLDVSVPWVGRLQAMNSLAAGRYSLRGLSHSEISGSRPVSGSPKLFAAVHVLHRLSSPRHPPCALCSLTVPLRHASR